MANVLITEFMDKTQIRRLSKVHNVIYNPELYNDSKSLLKKANEVHALIVRNKTNVDKKLLDSMRSLKVIGRLGVGLDNIDVDYCKIKNVPVIIAEGANAKSVSEYVIMGLFTLFRGIRTSTEDILSKKWDRNKHTGSEINGKTLGIIGIGSIGKIVAKNASGLGMNLIGNDIKISKDDEIWEKLNIKYSSFDEVISQSDVITIHVPLTKKTYNLLGENEFKNMVKGSFIINSSRGGIVNEKDLLKFLKNGHLGGAMLDVFETEPLNQVSKFLGIENLILTPHIAGLTHESNIRVSQVITNKVLNHLAHGEQ
tara:strand:- start:2070 stop:3005 length:936 start_codon:yes stop_codon:yes gene_type:complete